MIYNEAAAEFYQSDFWQAERAYVLAELGTRCNRCGVNSRGPHVHHRYGLPEDDLYETQALDSYEVLCPDCHAAHHRRPHLARVGRR